MKEYSGAGSFGSKLERQELRNYNALSDTENSRLLKRLLRTLSEMRHTVENLAEDDESPFWRCTACAEHVVHEIGFGEIWGYEHAQNPEATLGSVEEGHDFAIIGTFLVDHWAQDYYDLPWLYDLRDDLQCRAVTANYGNPDLWLKYDHSKRRFVKAGEGPSLPM